MGYLSNLLENTLLPQFFVFRDRDIKFWPFFTFLSLCKVSELVEWKEFRQEIPVWVATRPRIVFLDIIPTTQVGHLYGFFPSQTIQNNPQNDSWRNIFLNGFIIYVFNVIEWASITVIFFSTKKFFKHARCINLFLGHSDAIELKEQENKFIAVIKEDGKNVIIIKKTSWIL